MKKSIAVLGLGRYGMSFAKNMYAMGADVLVADENEEHIRDFADNCTSAICADLSNEEEVLALGLKNMDIVVCAMGRNLAASIMSVAVAKEQGVPLVVAKSSSDRMSSILKKVGADKVIIPEDFAGMSSARILASDTILDYFQVDSNICMIEMKTKESWIGKTILELDLRKKFKLNVAAIKEGNSSWTFIDPNKIINENSKFLIVMERSSLKNLHQAE
ncbi:MAG: TrkA family potassium uptake protein [Elusimicrobiales bacterium]|nr:TrkA family potassium uptake protein [Elusimicrobiales bacterium]